MCGGFSLANLTVAMIYGSTLLTGDDAMAFLPVTTLTTAVPGRFSFHLLKHVVAVDDPLLLDFW